MRHLLRNLRFGARMLARTPGVTLAIIGMLGLAIGANTALFTVTNAVLLRPFPYHDPTRLISIRVNDKDKEFGTTLGRFEAVRDLNHSFNSLAVWTNDNLNLTGDGDPMQVPVARVSPGFFATLGVRPQLGRLFTEDEGKPEGRQVVILSDGLWRTRYHADPGIVGKIITLDGTACTVVGVLPQVPFSFVGPADVWSPRYFELSLMTPQRLRMGVGYLSMLGRLRAEVSLSAANTELAMLNQRYREQNPTAPDAGPEIAMNAASLRELVAGDVRGKVEFLSGAVALVLLIACANAASLLLARTLVRQREIAVRTALGASRGILLGQLLAESLLLCLAAGALGIGLGWAGTQAFAQWGSGQLPYGVSLAMDGRVLAFTLAISVVAALLCGTLPAWQLTRADVQTALRNEGRGASMGRRRVALSGVLVAGQIALSLVLLIGAGLLLRSFVRLLQVDPGFSQHNLLTMNIALSTARYPKPEQQVAFFDQVLRRVAAVPGVRSAALSAAQPLSFIRVTPVLPEGQPEVPLAQRPFVDIEAISPVWFATMEVPLRGRPFNSEDTAQSPPVVVVNETFARQYWPNQNAVGKHVVVGRRAQPAEVVAVAADIRNRGLEQSTQPQLYLPFSQLPWSAMYLLVRTVVPAQSVATSVREQVAAVDRDQPVIKVLTAEELVDSSRAQPKLLLWLVGGFAGMALPLATLGVYATLSYAVAQREQEFGIRLALGAREADILRLVLRHGSILTLAGIVPGIIAAFLLTRLAASLLYQTGAHDALTFVVAPVLFFLIALLACYLPARRATQADPIDALR